MDIVDRLRARAADEAFTSLADDLTEAAAEIERLRAALERIANETAATWVADVARAALAPAGGDGAP
jgi:hypothetical protein